MRHSRHFLPPCRAALAAVFLAAAPAPAADLPPAVVASFTRRVQPLLLNRCAAGACHGGRESSAPRLTRAPGTTAPDRMQTRANLAAFLEAIGPDRDPRPLAALLAAGHPPMGDGPSRRVPPLSTAERLTLDRWLAEVRAAERLAGPADLGVVPVSAEVTEPASPPPNRFRALLDAAADPPPLPPPEEPQGVIFRNDAPLDE